MEYREAQLADLPKLLEIEQCIVDAERPFNIHIKSGNPTYYDIKELICSSDAMVMVGVAQGEIVATGYAQIRLSKASLEHEFHSYLGYMYVSPDFRGRGINGEIIELLKSWSLEKGVKHLYLEVYAQNTAAMKAYQKVGFDPCLLKMKLSLDEQI